MAQETFEKMISWVHKDEGEYSNDPGDPGGPTRLGITIHDYRKWFKDPAATAADVKAMSEADVKAIYRAWYWDPIRGDDLPAGVDYFLFDSGLLSGVGTASKWLQRAVGTKPDGRIGPRTLEAVQKDDPLQVLLKVEKLRRQSLRSLRLWSKFGRGWTNRVNKSKLRALTLIEAAK
jgi:lysozyme family protein